MQHKSIFFVGPPVHQMVHHFSGLRRFFGIRIIENDRKIEVLRWMAQRENPEVADAHWHRR